MNNEQIAAEWTRAQRTVAAYLATSLNDFHQADEVLARVAMAVVRKIDDYDPARPFGAWVIGIARRELLNYRRQLSTDKLVFDDALIERITESYQRQEEQLTGEREALAQCLQHIDERARQALELRYVEGLKPAVIAERMKVNGGATRMLLTRTRQALRECIGRRLRRTDASP